MRTSLITTAIVLLASGAAAQLAPYWVPDAGCVERFYFQYSSWTVEARTPLTLYREDGFGTDWQSYLYEFDEEQDVCWARVDWYQSSHGWDVESDWYTPPVKVVDYPLTTGKTWQTSTLMHTTTHSIARACVVTGTVIGPRVVETGLGPLDVIEISLHFDFAAVPPDYTLVYYLHDQLGDVRYLTELDGCAVVPVESTTWSRLKALHH